MNLPELPILPMNDPAAAHRVMYEYGKACAKQVSSWQPATTAPKDGTAFIGNIGYPFPVIVVWSKIDNVWVVANLRADMYQGKWLDVYFDTEHHAETELKAWQPLPELPKVDEL